VLGNCCGQAHFPAAPRLRGVRSIRDRPSRKRSWETSRPLPESISTSMNPKEASSIRNPG
jgi:hypothetical protein